MRHIEDVLKKHCDVDSINNIYNNFSKCVAIERNISIVNENNKCVGKIILLPENKKLYLNMIVEFREDKIKLKNSKIIDGVYQIILINPYWVKAYAHTPKIEVPINIYDVKSNQFVIVMTNLTYQQFQKRKLLEFYRTYKYILVAAYDNFNYLLKNNQYYYAINSTVKHYGLSEKDLKRTISLFNNQKKIIKKEWTKYLNIHLQENESEKLLDILYGKKETELLGNNIIDLQKRVNNHG